MEKFIGCVVASIVYLAISFVIDLGVAYLFWLIYNAVAPKFHLPVVDYWTMFYITIGLSLVGGFFRSANKKD